MGMFNTAPPALPQAREDWDRQYQDMFNNVLRLYFSQLNAEQPINVAQLNINIATLPTQTSLATLRSGDVYRDTTSNNVLKIKV